MIINHMNRQIHNNIRMVLALLKEAVTNESSESESFVDENTDWEFVVNIARTNKVEYLLYHAIQKNTKIKAIMADHADRWKENKIMNFKMQSKKYVAIKQLIEEAEKEKVRLVFFKGIVLAHLYSSFELRTSSDTDIFVYEKDKEQVNNILYKLGYEKNEEHSKVNVPVFVSRIHNHIIEVHYSLWEDYEGKAINTLDQMRLTSEASLIDMEACKLKISTLGHEEHFIYQMFHIVKHFVVDSVGLKYLIDISLFVNKFGNKIDYNRFWDSMEKLGYKTFCENFLHICVEYFCMDSEILLGRNERDHEAEQWLLMDMAYRGVLYETKTSQWQILGIMTPYLVGEEKAPVSGFRSKMKVLMPSAHALPAKFAYAQRNKVLLPIAWIHKIVDYLLRYRKYNKIHGDWYNGFEKLEAAEYRLQLIKKLGF